MEEDVFSYLCTRSLSENQLEYKSVQRHFFMPNLKGKYTQDEFKKAIVKLCSLGLIEVNFTPIQGLSMIAKTKEFYKAQRLGYKLWLIKYNQDTKREQRKIRHDATFSKFRAWFWWVSVVALLVSLVSLYLSIYHNS